MVRIMVGTMVEVGRGKRRPREVKQLLSGGCRSASGSTAPPQGLCLMEVYYDSVPMRREGSCLSRMGGKRP